jgi:Na+/proline symporter
MLAVIIAYFVLIIFVSALVHRRGRELRGYAIAGQGLSLIVACLTLVATRVGAVLVIGTASTAARSGFVALLYPLSVAVAFILLGFVLASKYNQTGIYTVTQLVRRAYGSTASLIAATLLTFYLIIVLAIQIQSGGNLLTTLVGWSPELSKVFLGGVAVLLVVLGGLWGIAYSDIVQLVLVYASLAMLAWSSARALGPAALSPANSMHFYGEHSMTGGTIASWFVASISTILVSQGFVQRVSAARGRNSARWAAILAGFLILPLGVFSTLIGMASSNAGSQFGGVAAFVSQAEAFPGIISHLLLLSLFAMLTSSAENVLHSVSLVSGFDLVGRFPKREGRAESRQLGYVKTMAIICGIVASIVAVGMSEDIVRTWVFGASIFGVSLFMPVVSAFYWRRSSIATVASMAVSAVIMMSSLVWPIESIMDPTILALLASALAYITLVLVLPSQYSKASLCTDVR